MSSKRSRADFDYAGRAAAAEAARRALGEAFARIQDRRDPKDPARAAWREAAERVWAAVEAAYPPTFAADYEALQRQDPAGLEGAVRFLEADPYFFRSGYLKVRLIALISRVRVGAAEMRRLRAVALSAVDGRDRREFRAYCRLAAFVDSAEFRRAVGERGTSPDPAVRRRARWMLDALDHAARTAAGRKRVHPATRSSDDSSVERA